MRRRGFTLIEMLTVLGIIAVIAGLSVAGIRALTRRGELDATTQALRSLIRQARNSARQERSAAVVEIDTEAGRCWARTRETVAFFRFEGIPAPTPADSGSSSGSSSGSGSGTPEVLPIPITGAPNVDAIVQGGPASVLGKIGSGLLFGEGPDLKTVPPQWVEVEEFPALNPVSGVAISCWIQPGHLEGKLSDSSEDGLQGLIPERVEDDEPARPASARSYDVKRGEMPSFTILRKGRAYELSLCADYSIEVAISGPGPEREEVKFIARSRPGIVRPERWASIDLSFDGRALILEVDGIERVLAPIDKDHEVLPKRLAVCKAPLRISDNSPRKTFYGVIDELKLSALIQSEGLTIPASILIIPEQTEIRFEAQGSLDPLAHSEAAKILLCDDPQVIEKVFPKEENRGSVERSAQDQGSIDEARAKELRNRAQKAIRQIDKVHLREVIIDRHGTLR